MLVKLKLSRIKKRILHIERLLRKLADKRDFRRSLKRSCAYAVRKFLYFLTSKKD